MASPFSPAGPIDQVPRLHRYYGDATPSCIAYRSLMVSLPASALPSLVSCFACALPSDRRRSFQARGISMPASPIPAFLRGQHRTSQVPWPSIPCLCHAPRPRPSPDILAHSVCLNAAPAPNATKAPAVTSSRGQTHTALTPAVYASRTELPLPRQDLLPAGGLAFTGRESNPLDRYERFPLLYIAFPFPRFILTLAGLTFGRRPSGPCGHGDFCRVISLNLPDASQIAPNEQAGGQHPFAFDC
jgi:hypothetical protein